MKSILVCLFVALLLVSASGQQKSETKQIDKYVKELTSYVERPSTKMEVYANVSETDRAIWRKFRSEKALEKFRESNEVYEIAYVWRRSSKVVAVSFTFTSGSGDWAHYVFHHFRPNGTLAFIEADLRTFYGYMSVRRVYYYSSSGKRIKKRTEYRDIRTDKPKDPGDDFLDNSVTIYRTTKRLPFLL